jgi:hypothetical protein
MTWPGIFVSSEVRENLIEEGRRRCPTQKMSKERYKPEQIVTIVRQIEV